MGTPAPSTKLGRYQVIKHLASGGMAEVLLARATGIEGFTRHVVIKRIRPANADNAQFIQMFLSEARLAAQLHHHNIVQVHDIGQEGQEYFFAMEYVHGEDLRRLLTNVARRAEKVPLEHVVSIVAATANALHYAHEMLGPDRKPLSLVHRDVSPANILVSYDGHVKVVDFGIAKAAATTHEATVAGALKGKASYMAPEQCTGKGIIDRRTDLFALGIVLYELTTTRRLFKGANDFLTMSAIVGGQVPPAKSHRPDLPDELDAIIMKALALDPAKRYQTAAEMQEALEGFVRTARLHSSTSSLATYMKQLFGERLEPWLVDDDGRIEPAPDFDGSASGMARAPVEAIEGNAIPETIGAMKSSPIVRARAKAATNAPPLAAVSTQHKSGPVGKPRVPTRQIAIPEQAAATPGKPVRRATLGDARLVPAAPGTERRKPITVQIPVAQQAAGAGAPMPRASTNLPGVADDIDAVPKSVDAAWDPSRPMAAAATASIIAADQARTHGSTNGASANGANGANGVSATGANEGGPMSTSGTGGPAKPSTSATSSSASGASPPSSTAPSTATPASSTAKPSTATPASTTPSTATPASTTAKPSTATPASTSAKPVATAGVPKSDPAINVIATPAASTTPKSDPAIKVDAKPATSTTPKSDPAIKVDSGAAPKPGDSSSRLSPGAFGRTAGTTGPAVSRTTTPVGGTTGPAVSRTTTPVGGTSGPAVSRTTTPVGGAATALGTTSTAAASAASSAASDATASTSSGGASATASAAASGATTGATGASGRGSTTSPPASRPAAAAALGKAALATKPKGDPTPMPGMAKVDAKADATPIPGTANVDAKADATPVAGTAKTTDEATSIDATPFPDELRADATPAGGAGKAKLPAPRSRAKLPGVDGTSEAKNLASSSGIMPFAVAAATGTGAESSDEVDDTAGALAAVRGDSDVDSASSPATGDSSAASSTDASESPFAAPPATDDSPFAAPSAAPTDSPFAAPAAASAAMAAASTFGGAAATPSTAADAWGDDVPATRSGMLAKVLASPKRIAIAAAALVVLIVVIVMAMGGDDKKATTGPDKAAAAGTHGDEDKGEPAVARDPAGDTDKTGDDKAGADPGDGTATGDDSADKAAAGDGADGSGDEADKGSATGDDAAASGDGASADSAADGAATDGADGAATTGAATSATTGTRKTTAAKTTAAKTTTTAKTTTAKTTAKTTTAKTTTAKTTTAKTAATKTTATKSTATKTTAKTGTKPATKTKPAVQKKCDPNSLFPCKKKK